MIILITITRAKFSLSSDRIKEFNRIINSLSNSFFKTKEYNKFNYFLLGIGLRAIKIFLSSLYKVFRTKILIIFYLVPMFYFLVFYSPLLWKLGENIIFYNSQKKQKLYLFYLVIKDLIIGINLILIDILI
jgi:hypothetical protein